MPPSTSPSPSPRPHQRSVPYRLRSSRSLVDDKKQPESPRIDQIRRGGDGEEARLRLRADVTEQTEQKRVRAGMVSMDEAFERERFRIARRAVRPSPFDVEAWPSKFRSAQPTVGVLSSSTSNSLPERRSLPPSLPLVAVPDSVDSTFICASSFCEFSPFLDLPPDSASSSPSFPCPLSSNCSPSPSPSSIPPVTPLDCHHLLDLVESPPSLRHTERARLPLFSRLPFPFSHGIHLLLPTSALSPLQSTAHPLAPPLFIRQHTDD